MNNLVERGDDMTFTITELAADAKLVYTADENRLIELADKYGVTTPSLDYAKRNPNPVYVSLGVQAFGTKRKRKEIERAVYAAIKQQARLNCKPQVRDRVKLVLK